MNELLGLLPPFLATFLERSLPTPRMVLILGPLLFLYGLAASRFSGWLRMTKGVRTPYTRKIFHFLIFTTAGLLQVFQGLPAVMLFGGIMAVLVLHAVWRGDGFPFYEAMARQTDAPKRSLFIVVPLFTTALGGLLSNLFFGAFAPIGYMVGGWGDAVGEPVGTRWGKHRYKVPSLAGVKATRSLEGSAAVCFMGIAAAAIGLFAAGVAGPTALGVGALCGIAGAAVEAVSSHGLDNLTCQLAASATAWYLLA